MLKNITDQLLIMRPMCLIAWKCGFNLIHVAKTDYFYVSN